MINLVTFIADTWEGAYINNPWSLGRALLLGEFPPVSITATQCVHGSAEQRLPVFSPVLVDPLAKFQQLSTQAQYYKDENSKTPELATVSVRGAITRL